MFEMIEKNEELKWFDYDQNNSGGYYYENEDVGCRVFVQAKNGSIADERMWKITYDYMDFCECCGERWCFYADEGTESPSVYGKKIEPDSESMNRIYGFFGSVAVFYFDDGRKVVVKKEDYEKFIQKRIEDEIG